MVHLPFKEEHQAVVKYRYNYATCIKEMNSKHAYLMKCDVANFTSEFSERKAFVAW